jgi:hypothetical protein
MALWYVTAFMPHNTETPVCHAGYLVVARTYIFKCVVRYDTKIKGEKKERK